MNADLCYKALRVVDYKSAIERQLIYYLPFFSCAHILCVFHRMIKFLWHRINPAKLAVILCAEAALLFFFFLNTNYVKTSLILRTYLKAFRGNFFQGFSPFDALLSLSCAVNFHFDIHPILDGAPFTNLTECILCTSKDYHPSFK